MVRKIKIFSSFQDIAGLEVEINNWLSENPNIRVVQTLQSENSAAQGWNLIISFLYETG